MTAQGERLLATLDAEIKNLSTLEHKLARTKLLLQEQATRLRLGASAEIVLTSLRLSVLHDTTLAVLERIDPVPKSAGGVAMPMYEYYCDKCDRDVTLTLTISEHDKGPIKCPKCGGKALRPLLSTFMSQTSKKS